MARKTEIIIGLAGKKRSGKTTAANHLLKLASEHGLQPIRIGFADTIKAEVAKIFGPCTDENKATIRPVYQAVGEAMKALHGEHVWVKRLQESWNHYRNHGFNVLIIDDVRFPYEADIIKGMGGHVWRITRPETDNHGDNHISESSVDSIVGDHVYTNEKKVEELLDWVSTTWHKHI